jgi:hypothetical protein
VLFEEVSGSRCSLCAEVVQERGIRVFEWNGPPRQAGSNRARGGSAVAIAGAMRMGSTVSAALGGHRVLRVKLLVNGLKLRRGGHAYRRAA